MTRILLPTRLDLLPPEEVARQMELARVTLLPDTEVQRIRRSLSGIAARLTRSRERQVKCLGALRAEVRALEGLVEREGVER